MEEKEKQEKEEKLEKQENMLNLGPNEKVGDYLRRIREARGVELDQMAKSIRLGKNVLQAIEDNNWKFFPTEAYLRSYIATICEKLSVDKKIVIRRFSADINSQFGVAQANLAGEQKHGEESSSNASKVAVVIILAVIAILFVVNKTFNSNGNSGERLAPEAPANEEVDILTEEDTENVIDSLAQSDSVVATVETVKTIPEAKTDTQDTLRFECSASETDNTCGVSLKGSDPKMNYFMRMTNRYIDHNDSAQVTITVPERTRLFVNNSRVDYGKFNTLIFYNGKIVNKLNRNLR
ncbi:MAG: helix-turn-helix domain-containing protein [Fibromonadaceae bacterium]|jgi:transcriptional regulator with XRE-family HTH domain|nr:helix-turn-helix domain-containing protein [Fibromonadaceae bacterium]